MDSFFVLVPGPGFVPSINSPIRLNHFGLGESLMISALTDSPTAGFSVVAASVNVCFWTVTKVLLVPLHIPYRDLNAVLLARP
jgi:hypothetical protein